MVIDIGSERNLKSIYYFDHGKDQAFIKIQDGCNNSAPIAQFLCKRKSKKQNEEEILITKLQKQAIRVVLTGIHISSMGHVGGRIYRVMPLAYYKSNWAIPGIDRIRLGS